MILDQTERKGDVPFSRFERLFIFIFIQLFILDVSTEYLHTCADLDGAVDTGHRRASSGWMVACSSKAARLTLHDRVRVGDDAGSLGRHDILVG